jgi:hypothetical protein
MYEWVNSIRGEVEPIEDPIYGSLYRCSLTLKDASEATIHTARS